MEEQVIKKRVKRNKILRTKEEKIVLGIISGIFILYSFTLIYPFIWAIFTSMKTQIEYKNNIFGFPQNFVLDNIIKALNTKDGSGTDLIGMFFNSIWSSLLSSFCGVLFSTMTAYAVTKYRFFGSKLFLPVAIILQALPLVGTMPAMFDMVKTLGLYNNPFLFWIVWCSGFGFGFVVLCGYFKSVSWDYAEAAFIDGATHFDVLLEVMIPLAFPAIFSLFLVGFINAWNDYYTMYLYMPNYPTLAVGIYRWKEIAAQNGGTPVYMAALVVSIIPVMILYACFQKTIMSASLGGGIKE